MRTGVKFIVGTALLLQATVWSANACAGEKSNSTPFSAYVSVSDKIYVYDKSLFSPYTGPDVSHWNQIYTEEPDDPTYDRKRLGIISVAPNLRVYVDVLFNPMDEYYEFIDVKTGQMVFSLQYYGGFTGTLLFNGQGSMYEYDRPAPLCTQGRAITKYNIKNGKLVIVPQPFVYFDNVSATTNKDAKLFFEPKTSSPVVASLASGTSVQVLTQDNNWLLVRTPLGLTGWVPGGETGSPLSDLYNCKS